MSETKARYVVPDGEQATPTLLALDTLEFVFAPDLPVEQAKATARAAVAALGLEAPTVAYHSYHNETGLYVYARVHAASGVLHTLNVMRLRVLRLSIEIELRGEGLGRTLDGAQAAMLADVCRILGLDAGETLFVMGEAYQQLIHGSNGGKA
jgi:hypothetical protein